MKLKFDKRLENTWFSRYLGNIRVVILLVLGILTVGIYSLTTLQRRLNPEVKLTIVSVVTILPGAGPADTESLVTIPLEDKLTGLNGIDTITSTSRDNASAIVMQFKSGVDKDKAKTDVQSAVDSVTTLPSDTQTPTVTAFDFEGQPIWQFAVTGSQDTASLMRYTDRLKKKIEDLPDIDRVTLDGWQAQQIEVKIDPEKVNSLGINPMQLSQALKTATTAFPAGSTNADGLNFSLSIDNQVASVEDIRQMTLNIQNRPVKLGEIARIDTKSEPNLTKTYLATPSSPAQQAVTFFVYKTSSADITKTVKGVEKLVEDEIGSTDGQYQVNSILNTGEEISKQFTDVLGEFRSTIILVFINLLLFLGLRQALIASITIPLTFLLSFGWMSILGQTINFLTLFALLLAFGTSIDDTIVTVSAMTSYYHTKRFSAHQTGLMIWRDFTVPIWTTTITTVWAFLPLILSTGIIGEFIKPIPITVATTMYSSTAVAWFITLPLLIVFLNPRFPSRVKKFIGGLLILLSIILITLISGNKALLLPILLTYAVLLWLTFRLRKELTKAAWDFIRRFRHTHAIKTFLAELFSLGFIDTEPLGRKYRQLITRILKSKRGRKLVLVCLGIYALVAYALIPTGLVKNEFFPKTNADNLYLNVDLPPGTDAATIDAEAKNLIGQLQSTPELKSVIADPGKQIDTRGGEADSPSSVLFSLILNPKEQRKQSSIDIAEQLRQQFSNYTKGKLAVIEQSGGPPAGADVQIKLLGDDLEILNQYADKTIRYLSTQPGVINVDKSIKPGTSKLTFVPDKTKLVQAGIGADTVGFWLRLWTSGFTLDKVRINNQDNDAVFYVNGQNLNPQQLGRVNIPTQSGSLPLLTLGRLELKNNPTIITHEAGKRTISVTAGVQPGYSISDANKKLIAYANDGLSLPNGYTWQTGGVNEENTKSVQSIFRAMALSFILIMATMVIEFSSFRQAAVILSLIPFAVAGVFYVFGLTGTPLSFPALIGVLALFGVVVTNAMFIVEKINQNHKRGMSIDEAIADAGQSRLEPIILTSLTSILGLIPITLGNALWRGLGGAIISGLLFSGVIMLFYIPVMYKTIYANSSKKR